MGSIIEVMKVKMIAAALDSDQGRRDILYDVFKRLLDILMSSLAIIFMIPSLCIISILIRLGSPGPIILSRKRVGKNGKIFRQFRFRTIKKEYINYNDLKEVDSKQKYTVIGRYLKNISMECLPELFNVLMGVV